MPAHRLEAPSDDGAVLASPPLDRAVDLADENRRRLDTWHYDFQGRSAARLRAMAREALSSDAREYSVPRTQFSGELRSYPEDTAYTSDRRSAISNQRLFFLTGHQPELFHPGVWIKNFAAHELARRCGGTSMHLVVDNDTVKRTTVRVPTGSPTEPSVVHVPLDRWQGEIPFEECRVADDGLFRRFGDRVAAAVRPLGFEPLATRFWPLAVSDGAAADRLGERIARSRRRQEAAWGCDNLELPVSRLCQTEAFYWFVCHILAQLPRFAAVYNQSLVDYRRRNGIRSRNHPVPELHADGEWIESPFWIWTSDEPRRRRLFARHAGREIELGDREAWTARLPLAADREACCAVDALDAIARRGVKIRTRALTTTLFTRLCLADLFIHGLGGARYDELADAIIERFFGLRPPGFMTLTGTLLLPVERRISDVSRVAGLRRHLRDLDYNPDRCLATGIAGAEVSNSLVSEKRRLIGERPTLRAERRGRFERLRQINKSLAAFVSDQRVETESALSAAQQAAAVTTIVNSRDWAFCVYPEQTLRQFMRTVGS
jgi:hypothetical protein